MNEEEVFKLINNQTFLQKNFWVYSYYHELPEDLITEVHLKGLYEFLSDDLDRHIESSSLRDVDFIIKYNKINKNAFIDCCEIILNKRLYSQYIVGVYFMSLFNPHRNEPRNIVKKFSKNIFLLIEVYFTIFSFGNNLDYDGKFLKELYMVEPLVLEKYIKVLLSEGYSSLRYSKRQLTVFFEFDNYVEIYNNIIDFYIKDCKIPLMKVPMFLESILFHDEYIETIGEKQDYWIRQYISNYSNNIKKMYYIFAVVSKLRNKDKVEYVQLYLMFNKSVDDFKKILLMPTSYSWSGSLIPLYDQWIKYLELLSTIFIGLDWIEHRLYIEELISNLKKRIKNEEIDEVLRGDI